MTAKTFSSILGKLLQAVINAFLCHKFIVAALLNNAFITKNNNDFGAADCT